MAYTPTTWASGDIISSAKLNKIEQGVAGAGGVAIFHAQLVWDEGADAEVVTVTENVSAIFSAFESGLLPVIDMVDEYNNHTTLMPVLHTFPENDYAGFLKFANATNMHTVLETQREMRVSSVIWDEGWAYEYYVETFVDDK